MGDVRPLPEEKAPAELKPIYETMKKKFGRMPNFFGMLANKPEVLKHFLPFYSAITGPGTLDELRSSSSRARVGEGRVIAQDQGAGLPSYFDHERVRVLNECAFRFGEADWHHRRANSRTRVLPSQQALRRQRQDGDSFCRSGHARSRYGARTGFANFAATLFTGADRRARSNRLRREFHEPCERLAHQRS